MTGEQGVRAPGTEQGGTRQGVRVVVMGVAGSGKTTVGRALAARLGADFVDGDDLHSAESIAKMRAGRPLTDADRGPWLERVGRTLAAGAGGSRAGAGDAMVSAGIVLACSALKRSYRATILSLEPRAVFVWLTAEPSTFAQRLASREGHFMPAGMLESQLDVLEPLGADEPGVAVDVAAQPDEVAQAAADWLLRMPA